MKDPLAKRLELLRRAERKLEAQLIHWRVNIQEAEQMPEYRDIVQLLGRRAN
jgi:hypothetical protein